ncbi:MAG: RrF2 family transcriptional regulator [Clostridia bacterium]|nr:RrF2 family transcriptional regulator [Clostridia bacterium]
MITTKGRYALRVMIDLAENGRGENIRLKDIAARQGISVKYLEAIMCELSKAGLLDAVHGKGGGYRLNRAPEDYTAYEILLAVETTLAPVSCLAGDENGCERAEDCRTLKMWREYDALTRSFFQKYTLADLVLTGDGGNYVI